MTPNVKESLLKQESSGAPEKTVSEDAVVKEEKEGDKTPRCRNTYYRSVGDALFSSLIVAPQVVSVWRGTLGLMELHKSLFPHAQIYVMGILIHITFSVIKTRLFAHSANAWEKGAGRWLWERFISKIYTYIFVLSCTMHWRGGWGMFDSIVAAAVPDPADPHRPVLIATFTILLYVAISVLRSSKNILATPYFLVTDGKEPTYMFSTRFQKLFVMNRETNWLSF